jgi:hypothetical protein
VSRAEDMGANLEELYKGGKVELPEVADQFTQAKDALGTVDAGTAFDRNVNLGLGASGPKTEFGSLVEALVKTLRETGDTMHDVATNLVITAQNFAKTDESVKAAFLKAGGKF